MFKESKGPIMDYGDSKPEGRDLQISSEKLSSLGLGVTVFESKNLPNEYINQLIANSRQPHILEFEGEEDAEGRFKDIDSYREWSSDKQRTMYVLHNNDEVAGLIWFGERENPNITPEYNVTFGIRLYEGYVGKGLSKDFMRLTHNDAKNVYPGSKFWLDFKTDNTAARRAYESFGYEYIGSEGEREIMGFTPEDN